MVPSKPNDPNTDYSEEDAQRRFLAAVKAGRARSVEAAPS
jgi:hypothetical protein